MEAGMHYSVIKAENISKKYSHRQGVENVSFEVEPGEIFGLLGTDHAGKSTIVNMLMGYFRPNNGNLTVFGLDSQREARSIRERIGLYPGNYPTPSRHTVAELLRSEGHRPGGMLWTEIQKLAGQLDLDLAQPAATLSSHDRQVFDLLQAFIPRPELLILDEPTYELKPAIQDVFYRLTTDARQDGRTVFFTSRSLSEMERICDRVALLHRGKLVAIERGVQLRSHAQRIVEMRFANPVTKDLFTGIPNIRNLSIEDNKARCVVQGEPDKLLKIISQQHVTDFLSTQPSLEQVLADTYGIKTI
jgi:ABC-2 type transport system ATP-binding protein